MINQSFTFEKLRIKNVNCYQLALIIIVGYRVIQNNASNAEHCWCHSVLTYYIFMLLRSLTAICLLKKWILVTSCEKFDMMRLSNSTAGLMM